MAYETVLTELSDDVLIITLNRPERLNAWTYQMGADLAAAVGGANESSEVAAIVLTGAGRGFCAGADIKDTFQAQQEGAVSGRPEIGDWVALARASKPIVVAVNGPAIGVGLTQCLPCDSIVASRDAKFGMGFIKMGLVPELASSRLLGERVGFGHASRLMLTGDVIDGEQAFAMGLADVLTEPEGLLPEAKAIASRMGANSPMALRMVKRLITENLSEADLSRAQQREVAALQECYRSPEHKEAIAAFIEKRKPVFR